MVDQTLSTLSDLRLCVSGGFGRFKEAIQGILRQGRDSGSDGAMIHQGPKQQKEQTVIDAGIATLGRMGSVTVRGGVGLHCSSSGRFCT